jgi:putative acetyltransferase
MNAVVIRPVEKKDNVQLFNLIRGVLEDFNIPKTGTAYADESLTCMFETYQKERSAYFVVVEEERVIGGGGIAQLDNYEGNVCELQKMYFLPEARGRGIGVALLKLCLSKARAFGYEKCYLETMTNMIVAQKLYEKQGFRYIDGPMGDTGHYSCPVHMIKEL